MKKVLFLSLIAVLVVAVACVKAGKGGKAKLSVHFYDKDKEVVKYSIIYIKYDAVKFPGAVLTAYDDSKDAGPTGHAIFENLKRGDYYLYGVLNDTISGGSHFDITNRIGEREVVIYEGEFD